MFKFDGVAGNPTELGMEMEAMLRTIAALRDKKGEGGEDEDDVRLGMRGSMAWLGGRVAGWVAG